MPIRKKQIDALMGKNVWTGPVAIPAGTSAVVTSLFTGKTPGGTDTATGVVTSGAKNSSALRLQATGKAVYDTNGKMIYGKLTEAAGVWTLSFYTMVGGSDTPYDFTGHASVGANLQFKYGEVVQFKDTAATDVISSGDDVDEVLIQAQVSGVTPKNKKLTVATDGQTAFTLSDSVAAGDVTKTELTVNGIEYTYGVHFTVSGNQLTWAGVEFGMETTDDVEVTYYL